MTSTSTPGSVGYGQMDPSDASSQFNMIAFIVRQLIARINTMKLVKVTAVKGTNTGDPGSVLVPGTVTVQPLVSQLDGQGNAIPHGTISGIPIMRMQSGINAICIDPAVGDIGFVVCADRDISSIKKTQQAGTPGSWRRFDLADGVYIGGLLGQIAPTNFVSINNQGITISDSSGNKVQLAVGGMTLTPAGNLLTVAGNLQVNGTIMSTGNITAGAIDLETHTHTGVTSGSSNTGPPVG